MIKLSSQKFAIAAVALWLCGCTGPRPDDAMDSGLNDASATDASKSEGVEHAENLRPGPSCDRQAECDADEVCWGGYCRGQADEPCDSGDDCPIGRYCALGPFEDCDGCIDGCMKESLCEAVATTCLPGTGEQVEERDAGDVGELVD